MKYLAIVILFVAGSVKVHAQKLASEKPVESFYSKTAKQNTGTKTKASKPASTRSGQELASAKAVPDPSVPARIQPANRTVNRRIGGNQKLASEKPVDMKRIDRLRKRH